MPMTSMHATKNPIATYMIGSIIWLRLLHTASEFLPHCHGRPRGASDPDD
jgi:hypothetical protein